MDYQRNQNFNTNKNYKLHRNKITSLRRQSKKNYYERYFEESINYSKETWRGITDITSRKAKCDKKPIHRPVNSSSETICNPKEISNSLNTFFLQLLDISWLPVSLLLRQMMILVPFEIRQCKFLSTLTLLPLQKSKLKSKAAKQQSLWTIFMPSQYFEIIQPYSLSALSSNLYSFSIIRFFPT